MHITKTSSGKTSYIFASCTPLHRGSFDRVSNDVKANWKYVSSNVELETVLSVTRPRYIFFLHWNWIVPESIWKEYECICFHMTDLPFGRGGSPLQNLILAGHTRTMLTAFRMDKEIDAGPVYAKRALPLNGAAHEVYLRAGVLSVEIIKWIIEHNPQPLPQVGEVVPFRRRKPEQSSLPGSGSLQDAYNFIRMLDADGYPSAFIEHNGYRISFTKARLDGDRVFAEVEIKLQNTT